MNPENLQPLPPGGKPAGETGFEQREPPAVSSQEVEFILEEVKNWPEYIRRRVDALNSVNSLNFEKLSQLLSEDPSLVSPELLDYLSQQLKLARENNQVLSTLPQEMVDCFAKLANDEDPYVRQGVALALGNLGEPALRILEEMKNDKNPYVRQGVALALHRLGKTDLALEILKQMKDDKDSYVRRSVALALGNLGEPALETLKEMRNDENPYVRKNVASALHQLGKTDLALKILEELKDDKDSYVRQGVASALGNLGEPALRILEEMKNDKDPYVRQGVASALGNLGEPALRILEEMKNDENPDVRREVALALAKIRLQRELDCKIREGEEKRKRIIRSLIVRQEPVFANPAIEAIYPEETQENPLLKLNDIISSLQKRYPNLIGLSVLGSLSKGYWIPSSDLDWSLIYTDMEPEDVEKMTEEFRRAAQEAGFRLCSNHSVDVTNPNSCRPASLEPVFNGIFIGDRGELRELQARIVRAIDEEGWEEIRQNWSDQLENYSKMIKRFGLTQEEVCGIQGLRRFLWGLPSLKEAQREFAPLSSPVKGAKNR